MKRALTIAAALMVPLLTLAGEPTSTPASPDTTATAAPAQQDSPMVAAAKRAKRKGKKPTNVITNETLSKSGTSDAHVSTTATQRPITMPKPAAPVAPTREMVAIRERDAAKRRVETEAAQQAKAAREAQIRAAAAAAIGQAIDEEGLFAESEGMAAAAREGATQTTDPNKPPQH